MPKKRPGPEQIVTLLRQIEIAMSQEKPAAKPAGSSESESYHPFLMRN